MTHYETLGISQKAPPDVVKAAAKALLRMYHPDNQSTGDAAMFRKVKAASDVLIDPVKRNAYDVSLNGNGHKPQRKKKAPADDGSINARAYPGAYPGPCQRSDAVEEAIMNLGVAMASEAVRNTLDNLPPGLKEVLQQALKNGGGKK